MARNRERDGRERRGSRGGGAAAGQMVRPLRLAGARGNDNWPRQIGNAPIRTMPRSARNPRGLMTGRSASASAFSGTCGASRSPTQRSASAWGRLVTNKFERSRPEGRRTGLGARAAVVVGGDTCPRAKPIYRFSCSSPGMVLRVETADALYVGDEERDVQAARARECGRVGGLRLIGGTARPIRNGAPTRSSIPQA